MRFYYRVHNLIINSSQPLPELREVKPQIADVLIDETVVLPHLLGEYITKGVVFSNELTYEHAGNQLLLQFNGVGRVLLSGGIRMEVEADPGVGWEELKLYLLGSGLGFLLLQRGVFPFHGSTVVIDNFGAIMFIGPSGVGKSTLATKFVQEGHQLLSDDVTVFEPNLHKPGLVYSGVCRVKLWNDSIQRLAYRRQEYSFILPGWEKKHLLFGEEIEQTEVPLRGIYCLSPSDKAQIIIHELDTLQKINSLMLNTYREMGVEMLSLQQPHFEWCVQVAKTIPIKRIERPVNTFEIDNLYETIMSDISAQFVENEQSKI